MRERDKWWCVTVKDATDEIVTIESECLSGREIGPDEDGTILKAASHLLGFIGRGYDADAAASLASKDAEIERLKAVIERDRTKTAEILGATNGVVRKWSWLGEGRGCYEWDDDRYQDEFKQMIDALKDATDPMRALAADWSDCPKDYEGARINWKERAESAESRLTAALAALGEAREALEPFSDADEYLEAETSGFVDDDPLTLTYRNEEACATDIGTVLSFGRFRKARATLAKLNALERNEDEPR